MSEIIKVSLDKIDSFRNHPFKVNNDESIKELMGSIKENGLLYPLVVREKVSGRYEMISGHRRKLALELLGMKEAEVTIKNLSDEEATIYMVDSNIYREKLLPSEKAFAYRMKLDAMKHQGKKDTSAQTVQKLTTREIMSKESGESREKIRKYIRLTYLIPELLKIVDNAVIYDKRTYLTIGITTAVELSYLSKEEQELVYNMIGYEDLTPSYAQAIKIRELSKNKQFDFKSLEGILDEKKGNQNERITFNKEKIEAVLPFDLVKRDKRYIEMYIIEAIKNYNMLKEKMRFD